MARAFIVGSVVCNYMKHWHPMVDHIRWSSVGDTLLEPLCHIAHNSFQGNEWPSQFKGFSLRWRQQKAKEMDLAATQALYQWLCFCGNMRGWTAVPSQHDSEWEELELTLKPSCSAELWICEWAMCCTEDRGDGCLKYKAVFFGGGIWFEKVWVFLYSKRDIYVFTIFCFEWREDQCNAVFCIMSCL